MRITFALQDSLFDASRKAKRAQYVSLAALAFESGCTSVTSDRDYGLVPGLEWGSFTVSCLLHGLECTMKSRA